MGKVFDGIDETLARWISAQPMWFVATAPLAGDGHVNVSPHGHDTFSALGPHRVGWVDYTGSGVETIAHLPENTALSSREERHQPGRDHPACSEFVGSGASAGDRFGGQRGHYGHQQDGRPRPDPRLASGCEPPMASVYTAPSAAAGAGPDRRSHSRPLSTPARANAAPPSSRRFV
jgi:hypothetical protein